MCNIIALDCCSFYSTSLHSSAATMTEINFIKSYLASLDSRPVKLPADYVFDPERVGLRVPVCLPTKNILR